MYYEKKSSNILTLYLSNRKQFEDFNGKTPSNLGVTCGVPQDSACGPLIFLIYTNESSSVCNYVDLLLYADDTTIVGELKTSYDALTLLDLWMSQNKF